MSKFLGPILFLILPVTAFAADLCVAPAQKDVDPDKTPIPLCLVAKKLH
jgi:hypothetical protein